jgi:hypothetical protein
MDVPHDERTGGPATSVEFEILSRCHHLPTVDPMKTLATAFALVGACALVVIVNEPLVSEPEASRVSTAEAVALNGRHAECADALADCGILYGQDDSPH